MIAIISEAQARTETTCRGCNRPKELKMVVCWDCFKHTTRFTPLKWAGCSFEEWQVMIRKEQEVA